MNQTSLFSDHWYRVSGLCPRLQPGTRIQRQILRNEEWYIFIHPLSQVHYRLNKKAYALVGRLDGEHSINALWLGLLKKLGDEAPTQDEVISMLAQLMDSGLVLYDKLPDLAMLEQNVKKKAKSLSRINPFSFRLRLFDPTTLLDKLSFLQAFLFHPLVWISCLVFIALAGLNAGLEWNALYTYGNTHLLSSRCLILAWPIYPVMKAIHESGHALAVRHWGGDIKEMGLGVLFLLPLPYVDASAATAFPGKWSRIIVSAAGILIELTLAAAAFFVWLNTTNGIVRDIAFVVMSIGGLSTVVFNGNPLLRFDGYYILCDLIEMPNLAVRSQHWWAHATKTLLGTIYDQMQKVSIRERLWLILYSPASWIYRLFIAIVMIQWVSDKSAFIGFIATIWLVFSLFLQPLNTLFWAFFAPTISFGQRWKSLLALSVLASLIGVSFLLPIPVNTVAPGVVWLPEQSQLRSSSDGEVVSILAKDGQSVQKGQPLIVLEAPSLISEKKRIEAQINQAIAEQIYGWQNIQEQGKNAFDKIERLNQELMQIDERINKLTLQAEVDGVFVLPHPEDIQGRTLLKGALIAYVLPANMTTIRVVVSHDDIGRIKEKVNSISVQLVEDESTYARGRLSRIVPAATNTLPTTALSDKGGGIYVTDTSDKNGLKTLEPIFLVDIELTEKKLTRVGGRAWVRFNHASEPLAQTIGWHFKQLFLKLFTERI